MQDQNNNVFYITEEGLQKLKAELEYLTKDKRFEIAERIKAAREYGDLSENSEYQEAMEQQSLLEAQISALENQIKNAVIIDEKTKKSKVVKIGSTVTIQTKKKEILTYQIVGKLEANPLKGLISNESPVGQALLGASEGDEITYNAPGGTYTIKVLEIK